MYFNNLRYLHIGEDILIERNYLKWCLKIISIMIGVVLYVSIWWAMPSGVNYYKKHPDNNGWNFVSLMYKFWIIGHIIATLLAFIWAWN